MSDSTVTALIQVSRYLCYVMNHVDVVTTLSINNTGGCDALWCLVQLTKSSKLWSDAAIHSNTWTFHLITGKVYLAVQVPLNM